MQDSIVRIGTRGSPLALAQANQVARNLMATHQRPESDFEIVIIKTSGDQILDRPLSEVGGKGLFTKELETALLSRKIDLAVHSMKDVATTLPEGLTVSSILKRGDVRDAFISLKYGAFSQLPKGATVGTSSLRRRAQLKALRPDLKVVEFRGNVQTRLKKLEQGIADATFLACAGLNRLGMSDRISSVVATETMLPAAAQGAIGIETRIDNDTARDLVAPLNHPETALCVTAERAFLARLDGSCRTPIGALGVLHGDGKSQKLVFRGQILSPDGQTTFADTAECNPAEAVCIADASGQKLLQQAGPGFFDDLTERPR
ncbi:MAG: hydroxymethylbilane synthase [Hyphomicrobiaceae bacterium]